ncbi:MAG: PD-(D/E)XK nuclease family protein [Myxococcaceae bacterium]|nr:MAG: PD-(D/E)XK nuclease family protein [Myxococcaceae bacterium]
MAGPLALPVVQPTALVQPRRFSYSSLQQMRQCARRWQLHHARYGDQTGYPESFSPAAEQGRLVHRLVSLLFRAMAAAGNPAPGSPAFQAAARELNALGKATTLLREVQQKLTTHPRHRGQQLRATAIEIYSAAAQLFQREYRPASHPPDSPPSRAWSGEASAGRSPDASQEALAQRLARQGRLSEQSLAHPSLPLHGIVDLLVQDPRGAIVIDFKTGAPQASHREQIELYGLLWWRQEGILPERGEVRYGTQAEAVPLEEATLHRLERVLAEDIARLQLTLASEAPATPGEHCRHCSVRPLCDRYWQEPMPDAAWVDAEVRIEGHDALGLRGHLPSGQAARVLLPHALAPLRAELGAGARTRWLNLRRAGETTALEATPQTEVFVVPE